MSVDEREICVGCGCEIDEGVYAINGKRLCQPCYFMEPGVVDDIERTEEFFRSRDVADEAVARQNARENCSECKGLGYVTRYIGHEGRGARFDCQCQKRVDQSAHNDGHKGSV